MLDSSPSETLNRVARYLYAEGYSRRRIRSELERLLRRADPGINLVGWQRAIDRQVRQADKAPLLEVDSIGITHRELMLAAGLPKKQLKRLLFTLIALAKYANARSAENHNWVNRDDREIFALANIHTSLRMQAYLTYDLLERGLLSYSKRVNNTNLQMLCLDPEGEPALWVSDYRNLGYQFLRWQGEAFLACGNCGIVARRKAPNQKYCPECAAEANRRKTLEQWYEKEQRKAATQPE